MSLLSPATGTTPATATRPAIMCVAMHYDRAALAPFVRSCRQQVPEGLIIVFTTDLSSETVAWLQAEGVEVIVDHFNPNHVFVGWRLAAYQMRVRLAYHVARFMTAGVGQGANRPLRNLVESMASVVTQRFYRYRRYLRAYPDRFSHVLLTDMRDVIFQSNPFPCAGLHVFAEDETIGQNHFARRWLQLSYGWNSWRSVQDRALLNVGTTMGDTASVLTYLDRLCGEFDSRLPFFWGADTAMHNYVIHHGLVPATLHLWGEGGILNLNAIPLNRLRVESGRLLAPNGQAFSVVHQYDRVKGLQLDATRTDGPP